MNVIPLQTKYKLDPIELACIFVFLQSNDKTFSWSNTVGIQSNSKNKSVLAFQWFRQERIQKFLFDHNIRENGQDSTAQDSSDSDLINKNDTNKNNSTNVSNISGDNIKELLEREYNKTTDPEKRTVLLIKIADFIGLKNSNEDDPLQPQIYLPARCQACPKYTQTNMSQTNE